MAEATRTPHAERVERCLPKQRAGQPDDPAGGLRHLGEELAGLAIVRLQAVSLIGDEQEEEARKAGVRSIPTTIVRVNGAEAGRMVGFSEAAWKKFVGGW